MLQSCVAGAAQLCDAIVAVDGPYLHFPGAGEKPGSPQEQADIIASTCADYGRASVVYNPKGVWASEVAKRDYMFEIAREHARPGDWFFRIDADEILSSAGYMTRDTLEWTPHDVAEVILWDHTYGGGSPLRALFRNVPDLRIEKAHYHVKAYEDTVLVGPHEVEAEQLWDVRLVHMTHERNRERRLLKAEYNKLIPEIERL